MKISGDSSPLSRAEDRTRGSGVRPAGSRRPARPGDTIEVSGPVVGDTSGHPGMNGSPGGDCRMSAGLHEVRSRLHERIRGGYYDNEEVMKTIACKLLDLFGL